MRHAWQYQTDVSMGTYIQIPRRFWSRLPFRIKLELGVLVFVEGGKPENPRRKPYGAGTTNNKLNPHVMLCPGIEPAPQWWKASALTTAPPSPNGRVMLMMSWTHIFEVVAFVNALVYLTPATHSVVQLLWSSDHSAVLSPQCKALYITFLPTLLFQVQASSALHASSQKDSK